MANGIDKVKAKVAKLLAQANDVAGTPEATVFEERAFDLMAKYGFEQRDLNSADDNEVIRREYDLTGTYTDMQANLLNHLAHALHCAAIMTPTYRSSKVSRVAVYGKRCHIDRLDMLFPLLNNSMGAQARNQTPTQFGVSTVNHRKSFMFGFMNHIAKRIIAMESTATEGSDSMTANSYAVVLLDDAKAARAAMEADNDSIGTRNSSRRYDAAAASAGRAAADRADIGQTRVNGMRALA